MTTSMLHDGINILLVEDNPGEVRLIKEALQASKTVKGLHVVQDGLEALAFLHRDGPYADAPRPNLILLDLTLPRKDGREVLAEIKSDKELKLIPVVVIATSQAEEDIFKAYSLGASCYVTKPVDLEDFMRLLRCIEDFWLTIAELPLERGT